MPSVFDFHAHVYPMEPLRWLSGRLPEQEERIRGLEGRVNSWRKQVRGILKPVLGPLHQAQTHFRYLPSSIRKGLDEVGSIVPLAGLFFESNKEDLAEAMKEAAVDRVLLIAHPPFIPNEFLLDLAVDDPRFSIAVNIPKESKRPAQLLRKYAQQGAKALKIHPAADGEGPKSARYHNLLEEAANLGMPVILHTGCMHSHLFYKDPSFGDVDLFDLWFQEYSNVRFVLAHMNMHAPQRALDLGDKYPNIWVDTSWQPAETIGEAVRRLGVDRVLFGTDWPLMGSNMRVGKKRIQDCIEIGLLKEDEAKLILGENAFKLLGISPDAG